MNKIVYDIGADRGCDTKNYLDLGYKVIAVDASPDNCNHLRNEFAQQIEQDDLIVVNRGIYDTSHKEVDFYINPKDSSVGSFIQILASRMFSGSNKYKSLYGVCKCVPVKIITLFDLIKTYGIPYYIKIDIEGFENTALLSLTEDIKPKFISSEIFRISTIKILGDLGYTKFRLIKQDVSGKVSGLFGDHINNEWVSFDKVIDQFKSNRDKSIWFDVHAK
jgi:FkbM family methyltransferase